MLVNKINLAAIFVNLKTIFNNAFTGTKTTWQKIAMEVPSTGSSNDYSWLSKFPKMRRWIGEKHIKALEAYKYTIPNEDFEATVAVSRNDIDDDSIGIYAPQAQMAGESAANLPEEIVSDLIVDGFTKKCYDGQYFFDIDHPVGGATVSNKGTMKLDISTAAAAKASYGAARTGMQKLADEEGRPLGVIPNILLVGPGNEYDARALIVNDRLEDGKPNPYKGTAEVVVNPRITNDNFWALLDTTKAVKPLIYQSRKKPVFVSMTDSDNENVFMRAEFLFGVEARAAGGYGFWQMAWASDGSA